MTDKIQAVFINFLNQKCFVVNLCYKKKSYISFKALCMLNHLKI